MSILDFGSGLLGAFASVMGLYQQQKTGKSAFFNTHMTTFALLIQAIGFSHFQQQALLYPRKIIKNPRKFLPKRNYIRACLNVWINSFV